MPGPDWSMFTTTSYTAITTADGPSRHSTNALATTRYTDPDDRLLLEVHLSPLRRLWNTLAPVRSQRQRDRTLGACFRPGPNPRLVDSALDIRRTRRVRTEIARDGARRATTTMQPGICPTHHAGRADVDGDPHASTAACCGNNCKAAARQPGRSDTPTIRRPSLGGLLQERLEQSRGVSQTSTYDPWRRLELVLCTGPQPKQNRYRAMPMTAVV